MKVTCNICGEDNVKTSLTCKHCGARLPIMPEEVIIPGTETTVKEMKEQQNKRRYEYNKRIDNASTNKKGLFIVLGIVFFMFSPLLGIIFFILAFKKNDNNVGKTIGATVGIFIAIMFICFIAVFALVAANFDKQQEMFENTLETEYEETVVDITKIEEYLDSYYTDYKYTEIENNDGDILYEVIVGDTTFNAVLSSVCYKYDCMYSYFDNFDAVYTSSKLDIYFTKLGYKFEKKESGSLFGYDDIVDDYNYYLYPSKDADEDKIASDLYSFYQDYKNDSALDSFMYIYLCNDGCKMISFNKYGKYSKEHFLSFVKSAATIDSSYNSNM